MVIVTLALFGGIVIAGALAKKFRKQKKSNSDILDEDLLESIKDDSSS